MKHKYYLPTITVLSSLLITSCHQGNTTDLNSTVILPANTVFSEQEIKILSEQACATLDNKSTILSINSDHYVRLKNITDILGYQVNDIALNYQIYADPTINAQAMANGCVRVNSGLMNVMSNNEILAVLAHELGHIALDHKRKAFQASHQIEASLKNHEIYIVVDKQFSYAQEIEADNYAFDLLIQQDIQPTTLLTMLSKLVQNSDINSSHPSLAIRNKNIMDKIKTHSIMQKDSQ